MKPILEITGHIEGKNAKVAIYPEYLTWTKTGRMGTGTKIALGAMTLGTSLAVTGIKGKEDQVAMPIRSITHVTSKRGKGFNTTVTVHCASGTLELRMHHNEADRVRDLLNQLVSGTYAPSIEKDEEQSAPRSLSEKTEDALQSAQKLMGAFNKFRGK